MTAASTVVKVDDRHAYKFLERQRLTFSGGRMVLDVRYDSHSSQKISGLHVKCGSLVKAVKIKEQYFAYWPITLVDTYRSGREDPRFSEVKIDVATEAGAPVPEYTISITCDGKAIRAEMPPEKVIDYYRAK